MKKQFRLTDNKEFNDIIARKNSVSNRSFVIYYQKNDIKHQRTGIAVSKKLGNAVVRNKIKRQIRMMSQNIFDLNYTLDCVIIVKNKYLQLDYEENRKELEYLYKKILKRMEK